MKENNKDRIKKSLSLSEANGISKSPPEGDLEGLSRKEFINKIFRYGLVGSLALLTGFLLVKRKVTIESTCTENFACKSCKKYSKCTLPEKA